MIRFYAVAAILLFIAACATTDPEAVAPVAKSAPAVAEGQEAVVEDPNEIICTRKKSVGSNVRRRVCRTRAQIEQEKAAADAWLKEYGLRSGGR